MLLIAAVMVFIAGCGSTQGKSGGEPGATADQFGDGSGSAGSGPQPGVVSGKVTDSQGNPLGDVDVSVKELNGAFSQDTKTDDQGNYRMKVDDGNYSVDAVVNTEYNGQYYRLPLYPKDGDNSTEEPVSEGIVEDFVWKISGLEAGEDPNSEDGLDYYGGFIQKIIVPQVGSEGIPDLSYLTGSTLRLTLTPDGPLMDGSQGKTLSGECTIGDNISIGEVGCAMWDIPLGVYTATAEVTSPDGATQALDVGFDAGWSSYEEPELGTSATVQFLPESAENPGNSGLQVAALYVLPAGEATQN